MIKINTFDSHIQQAFYEDCPKGDITTQSLNIQPKTVSANIIAKQDGVFFGEQLITPCLNQFKSISASNITTNGTFVQKNKHILELSGFHTELLILERTLLNYLQFLSGIATTTHQAVTLLDSATIKVCDTRKTLPGYRKLSKQAVVAGGGHNHREGLSDMILIKENHISVLKQENKLHKLPDYIYKAKKNNPQLKAEIEIENIEQLTQFDLSIFDYILLDNFKLSDINTAVIQARKHHFTGEFECSGNITPKTIQKYKNMPIQRLSMGYLTHSVSSFDMSLLINI